MTESAQNLLKSISITMKDRKHPWLIISMMRRLIHQTKKASAPYAAISAQLITSLTQWNSNILSLQHMPPGPAAWGTNTKSICLKILNLSWSQLLMCSTMNVTRNVVKWMVLKLEFVRMNFNSKESRSNSLFLKLKQTRDTRLKLNLINVSINF